MNNLETTTKKRAVIYCRVSTDKQAVNYSLETQEKICCDYADRNNYEVVEKFVEEGESAKTADRTKLKELLRYCYDKTNTISVVIFYKLDRFARQRMDYDVVCSGLRAKGLIIRSATEPIEETPTGRLMEGMLASYAQFDNEIRTERSVLGMRAALRAGRFIWGAPIGYNNIKIEDKGTITMSDKAPIVRVAFEEVAKNKEPAEVIYKSMIKIGLTNRKGKPLARSQFYEMLKNPLYAGVVQGFGESHEASFEPIVSKDLFDRVQFVLKYRSRKNYTAYQIQNPDFPLRRFIAHPEGVKMTGSWSKGRTKKYAYYRFPSKGIEISKDKLEGAFTEILNQFQFEKVIMTRFNASIKKHFQSATASQRNILQAIPKLIEEQEAKLDLAFLEKQKGTISEFIFQRQTQTIEKRLGELQEQLGQKTETKYDFNEMMDYVAEYLKNPSKIWVEAKFEKKLKLQWFQFPKGILFDGEKFKTEEIRSIYKVKDIFLPCKSDGVPPADHTSNGGKICYLQNLNPSSISDKEFWEQVKGDLIELKAILESD
ncbi:MAG TPA: recombinase family protein [Chitinophagales bacterium]|nr:recombinase family protein [Chitinophagales bacterium]HRG29388.1 recombinase family protein [Chitinophagales bacterium]HRG85198.1 recombinase family protein [Chitinophagales bacterium]HRH52279.1 recombinase family protein [Chitinophagales bacterium]